MNLPIEQILPSGAGLIATISGLVGVWFKFQNKVDNIDNYLREEKVRMKEEHEELMRQINAQWKWKESHEKEAAQIRASLNKDISEIRGGLLVTNEQFKQILEALKEIKERLTKLEEK